MKKMIITMMTLMALFVLPMSVMAAARTETTTSTSTKARGDGGTIETTVITTVTWETKGSNREIKTTVVTTIVVEKAPDGFVESKETTETTTVEETTTTSSNETKTKTKKKTTVVKNSSGLYADVTKKKVGTKAYKAIGHLKAHGAYKGVIKGNKFCPKRKITKKEYSKILRNLYGKYAPVSKSGAKATEKWALAQLVKVAKNMGIRIKWNGRNRKITRAEAAQFIKIFADYDSAFKLR